LCGWKAGAFLLLPTPRRAGLNNLDLRIAYEERGGAEVVIKPNNDKNEE